MGCLRAMSRTGRHDAQAIMSWPWNIKTSTGGRWRLCPGHLGQQPGDRQRLDIGVSVGGGPDQDRAASAHRQRGAQRLLGLPECLESCGTGIES